MPWAMCKSEPLPVSCAHCSLDCPISSLYGHATRIVVRNNRRIRDCTQLSRNTGEQRLHITVWPDITGQQEDRPTKGGGFARNLFREYREYCSRYHNSICIIQQMRIILWIYRIKLATSATIPYQYSNSTATRKARFQLTVSHASKYITRNGEQSRTQCRDARRPESVGTS